MLITLLIPVPHPLPDCGAGLITIVAESCTYSEPDVLTNWDGKPGRTRRP